MKTVTVRVPVTVEVEIEYPEPGHFTMPVFASSYGVIKDEACPVEEILVSAVQPSAYYFWLREKKQNHKSGGQVNFHQTINEIINKWFDITTAADAEAMMIDKNAKVTIDL